jgi:hypothetical protein
MRSAPANSVPSLAATWTAENTQERVSLSITVSAALHEVPVVLLGNPNLCAILAEPSLLLQLNRLKDVTLTNVWSFMSPSSRGTPHPSQCVLDLGACQSRLDVEVGLMHHPGHGHTLEYLDRAMYATSLWSRMSCSTTKFARRLVQPVSPRQMSTYWAAVSSKPMRSSGF